MTDALPPLWDSARDERLVCVAVRPETPDVSTFVFAAPEPRLFRFLPGQFMTLELPDLQRCYTIASPPTRPFRVEITVKRVPGGDGSLWLHRHLRPGTQIAASLPMGDFTIGERPRGPYLFLSAGVGITPLMSMARTLHDLGSAADLLFVHSAHDNAGQIFADELSAMTSRQGFRRLSIVSNAAARDGFSGRLSPALLAAIAPDLHTREIFCCGPDFYMEAVRAMLDAVGFDRTRYHEESFDFAQPSNDAADEEVIPLPPMSGFAVRFARAARTIDCPPGVTVLAAARAAGLRLPSACGKGVCGTCKSQVISGTVELQHGGGIRQREIDAGMTLLCCARPTSDLVVDR